MSIYYLSERDIKIPSIHRLVVREWIRLVIQHWGKKLGNISYLFTDDEGILMVNRQYLDHDYYTDIITFNTQIEEDEQTIFGDIVISLDTVQSNARLFGTDYSEELHRVLIHGVLHLIGLDDHTTDEKQAMRSAEDKALALLRELLKGKPLLRR